MKKIALFILFLSLFLLVGCSNTSNGSTPRKNEVMGNIQIMETNRFNVEQEEIQVPVDFDEEVLKKIEPIVTNQDAVDVGTNIIEALHKDGKLSEYTLASIIHSTEDNVWCFEYSIDQRDVDMDDLIDCGCLYAAIDGNEGTFIKAWLEE